MLQNKKNIPDFRIAADEWAVCPSCHFQHPPEHEHWEEAKVNGETPLDQPLVRVVEVTASAGVDSRERPARNKEKYNAYMRDYMKRRRLLKKTQGAMA